MLSRAVWAWNKTDWVDRILKDFHPNKNLSPHTFLFYNLESPFTEKTDNDFARPWFIFKSHKNNIKVLTDLKQKYPMLVSLANNHITNGLWEWIESTIKILKNNSIGSVWVWTKKTQIYETQVNKVKICVWAYSYDGWEKNLRNAKNKVTKYYVNAIDEKKIKKDLQQMKQKKCEIRIISLHWWREYLYNPTKSQQKLARNIVDAGADLILGHHSHIPGKIEIYKGKYIYYSLWNFIFDQDWWAKYPGTDMSTVYDGVLKRYTVPTYIWNTYDHHYSISENGNISLKNVENIKHRIELWKLYPYSKKPSKK